MTRVLRSSSLVLAWILAGFATAQESRVWKDATGSFQVEATLVKVEQDKAYLRKTDGREVAVPLDKLSAADREFLAKRPGSDPFQSPAAAAGGNPGLVVIASKVGTQEMLSAGMVYRTAADKTYIVTDAPGENFPGSRNPPAATTPPTFTAIWDSGEKRNKVELELVAHMRRKGKYVLRGPANQLPKPLDARATEKPNDGQSVRIVGFEIDQGTRSFTDFKLDANVTKIFRDADGGVARFQVEAKNPLPGRVAVVLNEKHQPLGMIGMNMSPSNPMLLGSALAVFPVPKSDLWEEAEFGRTTFYPVAGDRKRVTWQVAVDFADPLGKMSKAVVLFKRLPTGPGGGNFNRQPPAAGEPFDDKATQLELKPGKPSEALANVLNASGAAPTSNYLVGQFEEPNPGVQEHLFTMQLGYTLAGAATEKLTWLPPQQLHYRPNVVPNATSSAPDIPGFDGRPLDMPRPVKVEGGYQITSEVSVPEPPITATKPATAPKPEKSTASLAGEVTKGEKLGAQQLTIKPFNKKDYDRSTALATYSKDGRSIYVIDGDNILHKFDALTLQESVKLPLGAKARDLQVCQAGVLVSLAKTNILWLIHADTLEVQQEFAVPEVGCIGASGGSNVGFVISNKSDGNIAIKSPELWMIDFAQGKVLHVVKSRFKQHAFTTPAGNPLESHFLVMNMRMSADGKYLFLGDGHIRRFRIEKPGDQPQLVFEEASAHLSSGHTTHFMSSDDGKLAALPSGGGNGSGYDIRVLNGFKLSETIVDLNNGAYPCSIGFDLKSGNYYAAGDGHMQIFSRTGEKFTELKLADRDVRRILVDPRGDRFLACGESSFTIYDLQLGRLK